MTLAFENITVQLNVFHNSNQPIVMDDLEEVNIIESLISSSFEGSSYSDPLEKCVTQFGQDFDEKSYIEEVNALLDLIPTMDTSQWARKFESLSVSESIPVPSIVKSPQLELKTLSETLKYVYLGESETLPVIIASDLSLEQEEKLLSVLRENSEANEWSIANIKGISLSVV